MKTVNNYFVLLLFELVALEGEVVAIVVVATIVS